MFCTVTMTEWDENGHLLVQHDAYGEGGVPGSMNAHQYGFLSRPHDPGNDGVGCTVDVVSDGSERFAWIKDDTRSTQWLPRCTKGGSAQYGGKLGSALTWREIDGDTGSIIDYVPVAWDSDGVCTDAHKLELGVDGDGKPIAQIIHSDGTALVMVDGVATLGAPGGSVFLQVSDSGWSIGGSGNVVGGLDVGQGGGTPVALYDGVSAALQALSSGVSAAATGSMDGGAALKVGLVAACQAMIAALAAAQATMLKAM